MATMDVFRQDPFSMIEMTAAVERNPFQPTGIGELNLFDPQPIRVKTLMIEGRDGLLTLIPTTPRGAPGTERVTEKRNARYFETVRLRQGDTLYAEEIAGIRAFGAETELMQAQAEIGRRLNGPTGLLRNIEYTMEHMRLGAVQGILVDADGSTIYNWFTEFGISQPAEIAFDLNNASPTDGDLRIVCNGVVRTMARAAKGAFINSTRVMGLVGDDFWDALVSHPDVTKTYYNWLAASELRKGTAFQAMTFGGIDWVNYRGSDDNSEIAIAHDKAKFFPVGAPGVFRCAYSPAESFEFVNTPGKATPYVKMIYDRDRDEWVRAEASLYPLPICTRPDVLLRGKQGA